LLGVEVYGGFGHGGGTGIPRHEGGDGGVDGAGRLWLRGGGGSIMPRDPTFLIRRSMLMRPRWGRLAIAGLIVFLLLGGLEMFCRMYLGLGDPPLSRFDPEMEYLFVGPRVYHRFGNVIAYNRYSMRSRDFTPIRSDPNEIRVMFCGDSVINGGALTGQHDLATSRIERRLAEQFKRPAVVMNISAGSWGPPNYLAYVRRYGFFESNLLVIVVSSHDYRDAPTFEPLVGTSDFPDRTPRFALGEALTRYLPRYLPKFGSTPPAAPLTFSQGEIDTATGAFRTLIGLARERKIPVIVAQHLEEGEYDKPESEGHAALRKIAEELKVPVVQLGDAMGAARKQGKNNPYRDDIHPSTHGQQLMAEALFPEIEKVIAHSATLPVSAVPATAASR
jgi:hypothetical protein